MAYVDLVLYIFLEHLFFFIIYSFLILKIGTIPNKIPQAWYKKLSYNKPYKRELSRKEKKIKNNFLEVLVKIVLNDKATSNNNNMMYGYDPKLLKEYGSAILSWIYNNPLKINRVSNWLFTLLWVISTFYYIVDPRLHIHPTRTIRFVSFALFRPFSLSSLPTDIPRPWQGFILFHIFSPYLPCAKWVPRFGGGDIINPVTFTNEDAMAPQWSSPYFCHDIWSIFHHPSENSPWDTHISTPAKPPPLPHEVQRYWEASWRSDIPSPRWGKERLPKLKRRCQGTGRVCGEMFRAWAVRTSLYHTGRAYI